MKSRAAVLFEQNKPLKFTDLVLGSLEEDQVLIQMEFAGICRSQINEIKGRKGEDKFLPHTLGHEGVGTVSRIGSAVNDLSVGDRVVLSWLPSTYKKRSSGFSYLSADGAVLINSGPVSTFLTRAIVARDRVVKIPDGIPSDVAALFGCAIPTGMGMIEKQCRITSESSLAIFGVGGVGMSACLAASIHMPRICIAVDISEEKRDLALRLGATHVINPESEDVLQRIFEITNDTGLDYAIEATGIISILEIAYTSVRENGGKCIVAGNPPLAQKMMLDPFDLIKGKKIEGSWGGNSSIDEDVPAYFEALSSSIKKLRELLSAVYPFEKINELISDIEKGKIVRGLVSFNKA